MNDSDIHDLVYRLALKATHGSCSRNTSTEGLLYLVDYELDRLSRTVDKISSAQSTEYLRISREYAQLQNAYQRLIDDTTLQNSTPWWRFW